MPVNKGNVLKQEPHGMMFLIYFCASI